MRFLSVCSGIEAASVAFNPLGWKAIAFSEIEPFPCAVLKHHYPDTPNRGDMNKYKDWPDEPIDLLCGGTPCQSFSVAGLRKGLDDPRGNLMLTFGAIAAKYRPQWLVWENVPGVLSSNAGADFGAFLGMLGQLGYGFAYRILDAQYFGVAQRRRRVFVVGCLGDWRSAAAVLFERHSLQGHSAPRRTPGKEIATTLASRARSGSGYGPDTECPVIPMYAAPHAAISPSLKARDSKGPSSDGDGDGDGAILVPMVPIPFDTTQITSAANYSNPKAGDPCHPLAAQAHVPAIAFNTSGYGASVDDITASTMQASYDRLSNQVYGCITPAMQVRRLTPGECESLQGFPQGYTAIPHRGKPAADGPRYKALGNSWVVPNVRWIGQRIEAVDLIRRAQAAAKQIAELEAA